MENFDIVKYLKENKLGSYGMFNGYVDLKPLKEEEKETELDTVIPYEGPEHKLTGNGEGDEFEQEETLPEEMDVDGEPDFPRIMDLGGEKIEQGVISLMDAGFEAQDILQLCKDFIKEHELDRKRSVKF